MRVPSKHLAKHGVSCQSASATSACAEWGRGQGWEAAGLPDLWRPYVTGGLRVEVVPGTHIAMVNEPYVEILAEAIEQVITGAPAPVA